MSALEAATLPMLLTELRLPTIKRLWPDLAEQKDRLFLESDSRRSRFLYGSVY